MKKRFCFRLPILPVLIFFNLFSFNTITVFAQESEPQITISIQILETGYNNVDDKGKNNYVWKFYKGNTTNESYVLRNSKQETCFRLRSRKNTKSKDINEEKDDLRPFTANLSGFDITMEAFLNKKGGEKCISDPKDNPYSKTIFHITPDKLANTQSDEIRIQDNFGIFHAVVVYKYTLTDGLSKIEFPASNSIIDASKDIVLNLPIQLPKKETLPFTWSYSIGDEDKWTSIPNSAEDKSKIDFNPLKTIFVNKQLIGSQKVNFKAEIEMNGKTETTEILTLTLAAPPPVIEKENMHLIPVCNGLTNGSIEIKNIKTSASEIKYVLRKKPETDQPCNLKDPTAESCPGFVRNGTIATNKTLRIKSLAAGEYLLYIFNADQESGEVNTITPVAITELTPYNILDNESSVKNPTCDNVKGGEIYMKIEGASNLWQIAIVPNEGSFKWDGNILSVKNLEAKKYTIYLSDQCGPEKSRTYNLKKPKQISVDTKDITPLQDKADFYIQLNVLNGSNNYKVKTTDQDNNAIESIFAFLPDMKIPISKAGVYTIEIKDVDTPCPPLRLKIKVDKATGKTKFKLSVMDN